MHITALVKSRDHVCCRYRVAAFHSHWQTLGHHVDICPWSSGWALQQWIPAFLDSLDTLIVQRKLFSSWHLGRLRRNSRRMIYDFDDAIFVRSSYDPRGHDCPKRFKQFREMIQTADVVVAGNDFLAEQAEALTEPSKLVRIPTCVDVDRYPLARHDGNLPRVSLVWIGSASTLRGLERIQSLLERLGQRLPSLELRVICDRSLQLEHMPVQFRPWSEATETRDLAHADIGISWLPDDAWSAGKCGLKVLQYMAAGLPVVANPVGVQKKLVRHGESGFLVESPEEWEEAVQTLACDPDLRREMGAAGRQRVETEFSLPQAASAWQNLLQSLESKKRQPAL